MLAFMTRMEGAPVLVKVPVTIAEPEKTVEPRKGVEFPVAEGPGVTPLGEVKPRRGRPAKVKTEAVEVPAVMAASMREAEEAMAKAEQTPAEQEQAASAAKAEANSTPVEAVPEKPKAVSFEEMRAAAVALAGKENGRARLTAILQAEAGVANLSGVPDEKRFAVVKALTEAANG